MARCHGCRRKPEFACVRASAFAGFYRVLRFCRRCVPKRAARFTNAQLVTLRKSIWDFVA